MLQLVSHFIFWNYNTDPHIISEAQIVASDLQGVIVNDEFTYRVESLN